MANTSSSASTADSDKRSGRDGAGLSKSASGGEDESSTERGGDDSHLHEDQKSRTLPV